MQTEQNQAITMHPLFFDPIYKKALFENIDGKMGIRYVDEKCGVRVYENRDIRFSMYAPTAKTVEVAGISGSFSGVKIPLRKDENGFFTNKISGMAPGFHYHNWYVDGVRVTNPIAPITYGCFGATNFFEVPNSNDDFWLMKDVPHGDVSLKLYQSRVNDHVKQCYVYTPPFYGRNPDKKYPVLYVQHGVGEDEIGWIWSGKLNFILDNLIAEGKCEEMIVVMCCGYAFRRNENPVFYPGAFDKELVEDCIPFIESNFLVKKGRENRAMAGLSLGSAQATQIVARYQRLFGYLGVFSGIRDDEMDIILKNNSEYPMIKVLLTAGVGEKGIHDQQAKYVEKLKNEGIWADNRTYNGFHEWHVWRESVRDFASLIFREEDIKSCKGLTANVEPEFKYFEEVISLEQLDAQTFAQHILMFDPIHKGLKFDFDEFGRPAGKYIQEPCGVEIENEETGKAKFYFRAKEAENVSVDIWGSEPVAMTKQEDDWWTVEIDNIEAGFHYYGIKVNGVDVVDPNAPVGYGGFRAVNYFEMPEKEYEDYRIRQVPHGTIHMNYYLSKETNRQKLCYVYTPASYDTNPDRRYPVLYLQHGGGENETGWIWQGKIANIADNLIDSGKMEEMIIVMNTGYGFPLDEGVKIQPSMSALLDELPGSAIPFIDANYRTLADKENRALAGLSMGAMQTQKIAFAHPELFRSAGIFSGSLTIKNEEDDYSNILLNKEEFEKRFKVLFVGCGLEEGMYEVTKKNEDMVLAAGVPIVTYAAHGYHDWTFWRKCARQFLPLLFK